MEVHYPRLLIRFCTGCKWGLRANWYQQELLSTFGNTIGEIALSPAEPGEFRVFVQLSSHSAPELLWDRKEKDGFPDSKLLKQLVRDKIDSAKSLGHSEKQGSLQTS